MNIHALQAGMQALTLAPEKDVFLYADKEAGPNCLKTIRAALQLHLGDRVQDVDARFFQETNWIHRAKLIVIPGGWFTAPFHNALGKTGMDNIWTAVTTHKVAFLGSCAGAYLVSQTMSSHDIKWPQLQHTPGFFRENADGPVAQPPRAEKNQIRETALTLNRETFTGHCPYAGGPIFQNAAALPDVEVLASYVPGGNRAAMIHCTEGGINALLTGLHPELAISNQLLQPDEVAEVDTAFAYVVWHTMLHRLGMIAENDITPLDPQTNNIIYSYLFK